MQITTIKRLFIILLSVLSTSIYASEYMSLCTISIGISSETSSQDAPSFSNELNPFSNPDMGEDIFSDTSFNTLAGSLEGWGDRPDSGQAIGQVPTGGGMGVMIFLSIVYGLITRHRLIKLRNVKIK